MSQSFCKLPTRIFTLLFLLGCWALVSCGTDTRHNAAIRIEAPGDTSRYIRYAEGFRVEKFKTHQLLTVYSPFRSDTLRYLLVRKGEPLPEAVPGMQILQVPVKRIAVTSSTHAGLIDFLKAADALCAVGSRKYIYSGEIRKRISENLIAEIGRGESAIDEEKTIALKPDLLMDSGNPESGSGSYASLTAAGIPVLPNFEWKETTPLGRAEWLKLMALLLDRQEAADTLFLQIEKSYHEVAAQAAREARRPRILVGNNLKDIWYMPGGRSYLARLLQDAGAAYHWSDTPETGSLSLSFETVYPWAMSADCWINMYTNGPGQTRQELAAMDSRYTDFKAFKTGALYTFANRVNAEGANDYWESGGVRPDLVLSDLVKILHPGLLPDHTLYYYKKLN